MELICRAINAITLTATVFWRKVGGEN